MTKKLKVEKDVKFDYSTSLHTKTQILDLDSRILRLEGAVSAMK
jgi:hypothetical protein